MNRQYSKTAGRILAVVFLAFSGSLATALWFQWGDVSQWSRIGQSWAWLISGLCFFLGLILIQTGWKDERSASILRLDWFLPSIKRLPAGTRPGRSMGSRMLRRLGLGLQSDWQKKKRGHLRKLLRRLGGSWTASPVRRLSQSICFLLFCWLFFYVCWPYHAKPVPVQVVGNLTFLMFDQEQGTLRFSAANRDSDVDQTPTVFLSPDNRSAPVPENSGPLGEFNVVADSGDAMELKPIGELSDALLDVITGVSDSDAFIATDRDPFAWPGHYADSLRGKEVLPAEAFLMIDPLVSLSTAIASRSWVWSLGCAAAILIVCVFIPRGFCGYLCPLGTTIDLFDWAIGRRVTRLRVPDDGWWVHIKYYLLAGTLVSACLGVLVSGLFSAIPVLTRGMLFLVDPFQNGFARGWHLVPAIGAGQILSIGLFLVVLCLGFLRPRFWCKYVCPSGAVFSLGNLFRMTERKVESSCIHCNKCVEVCPFDAIKPDFTTRETDCTLCQTCAGVCPTHAIKFVERWNVVELKVENDPPTGETQLGRRGFLSLAAGSAAAVVGGSATAIGVKASNSLPIISDDAGSLPVLPVRPPGSVPEPEFLQMCIRCGECFKACPNNVLQPEGFQQGLEGLWTPLVEADWAGCESSCNACGQVCPTGAIRALPLEEKRVARMGLAVVNESTCLPLVGKEECDLCVQECQAAGYDAIEYTQVGVETDSDGHPIEGTGFSAPLVLADKCVGCGLCQTRCFAINVKDRQVLSESAIIIETGEGKEDRMMSGSYIALRQQSLDQPRDDASDGRSEVDVQSDVAADPFGIGPAESESETPSSDAPSLDNAPSLDEESPF